MATSVLGDVQAKDYTLEVHPAMAWLYTNRLFGNMAPNDYAERQERLERASALIGEFSAATEVVAMSSYQPESQFVDLDKVDIPSRSHWTDGLITTDMSKILHATPADCGEIAIHGFSPKSEKGVIALVHAGRKAVQERIPECILTYLATEYEVDIETISASFAPSARAESFKKPSEAINEEQKTSSRWEDYMYIDEDGLWHIDFHGRTVQDLRDFGISEDNISDCGIDTIADLNYFSYMRYAQGHDLFGGNGVMLALR